MPSRPPSLAKPYYPVQVTDLDLAFPATVLRLMPPIEDIPEVDEGWNELARALFTGRYTDLSFLPSVYLTDWIVDSQRAATVEGGDVYLEMAWRHVRTILGSWEPKHQHKEATVAYLLSLWFRWATWKQDGQQRTAGSEEYTL